MTYQEAVAREVGTMSGALCFRGTRVPVRTLFDYLEADQLADFYEDFPGVTSEMVEAVIHEAGGLIDAQAKSA